MDETDANAGSRLQRVLAPQRLIEQGFAETNNRSTCFPPHPNV
jgi:hypothetical protein